MRDLKKSQKMNRDLSKLEKKLDLKFKNKNLLKQSLIHRSYLNENPDFGLDHNERLEFLGDAVLELIVTEHLYRNFNQPEGELTSWRASLVNGRSLSELAQKLELNNFLYLSKGETNSIGKAREIILANAVEALIGAIYLDQGLKSATKFIQKNILVKLPHILKHHLYQDPKSGFQEIAQAKYKITPAYKVLKEIGPDHNKEFTIGVFLNDKLIAEGKGSSKQEAETKAAANALTKI